VAHRGRQQGSTHVGSGSVAEVEACLPPSTLGRVPCHRAAADNVSAVAVHGGGAPGGLWLDLAP
jgi:hypothetical protein